MFYRQHDLKSWGVNTGIKAGHRALQKHQPMAWMARPGAYPGQGAGYGRMTLFVRPWDQFQGKRSGYVHLFINIFRCRRKNYSMRCSMREMLSDVGTSIPESGKA